MPPIEIPRTFGEGGAHFTSNDSAGKPSLKQILQQMADQLNGIPSSSGPAITAPALPAFSDPPTASQMADLRTLVNQIRARLV